MSWDFPDPELADENGLLCIGADLEVETLHNAYSQGIYPWPQAGLPLLWFSPPARGVLDFNRLHVPRSLKKVCRDHPYRFTVDQAFEQVIRHCAEARRSDQHGTW